MLNTLYHERLMQGYAPDNCDLGVMQRALAMLTNNGLPEFDICRMTSLY